LKELMVTALQAACDAGAVFADVRWEEKVVQNVSARGHVLSVMSDQTGSGFSVRVFYKGAWGFSAGPVDNLDDAVRLGRIAIEIASASASIQTQPMVLTPVQVYQDVWRTPIETDPFTVPISEKTALLLSVNAAMLETPQVKDCHSHMRFVRRNKLYANTEGSFIDQTIYWSEVNFSAIAVGEGRFASRDYNGFPRGQGYELITNQPLLQEAPRVASEAVQKLKAKPFDKETTDLVLLPTHTQLVIHETIGHPTELDRVLGWEADYAGTSFAIPESLNTLQYGSPAFNVIADRTQPHGMSTCAYDDDGVKTQRWHIIRDGLLTDYATTRDTAPFIERSDSRGCAFADDWNSFPILRMPNVCIESGPDDAPDLETLIADTENGVLVDGMGSFSIDHQRINFQFGSDFARRIRRGKIEDILWDFTYEGSNPTFWNSIDSICNASCWQPGGIWGCAKGQPVQTAALTHGSAPLRLRNIAVRRNGS
jgi:TldD protein